MVLASTKYTNRGVDKVRVASYCLLTLLQELEGIGYS
jgi:hypothetical protein